MTSLAQEDWSRAAAGVDSRSQALVDGAFVDAVSGETFDCIDPATLRVVAAVASCDTPDVDGAVRSARRAFESGVWSLAAPAERKRVLRRFAELLFEHRDELGLLVTLEMGKPVRDSVDVEIPLAASVMEWQAEVADKVYGEIAPTGPTDLALVTREPLGVVGAIVAWNFPVNLAASRIAPALAAGDSVVLKPAEQSPLSALRIGELGLEAGLPAGVLNVVPGIGGRAGRALALSMDVDCVAFTGSTAVGRLLLTFAGQSNMKQVWLECGGKSANIVFDDCSDLEQVATMAAMGVFWNQGEVCSSNSRLLVSRRIADELVERVTDRAHALRIGNPLDPETTLGPIVDVAHAGKVMGYIDRARPLARLVTCGNRVSIGDSECFVEPTIFTDVPPEAEIAQQEIFGPVLAGLPSNDEQQAVSLANGTQYGLGASLWTSDLGRAHRVARALGAGTVSVNTVDAYSVLTPFGGVRASGSGHDHSLHAIEHYTALKTTWIKC